MGLEVPAAFAEDRLQVIQRGEDAIGQWLVTQSPEALGWLQLGRVGRQEDQGQALRHDQFMAAMPAGLIEHQHDVDGWSDAHGRGKLRQRLAEQGCRDSGQEQPEGLAGEGMDEGVLIEPLVAGTAGRNGLLAAPVPDPPQDRLEAHPMLVHRPDGDPGIRSGLGHRAYLLGEPPL